MPHRNDIERPQPRSVEIDPFLVRAYAQTFIPRWDCYPKQLSDGNYIQIPEPLTTTHISRHLTSYLVGMEPLTIGAYALDTHSQARWLCLDADTEAQWQHVRRLAHILAEDDIPFYVEPSRRGGHLWLFTPPLAGQVIRQFTRTLLALHKVSEYGEDGKRRIDIYPRQEKLAEGPGSFVRLPLGIHQKVGRMYPFTTLDGTVLAPTVREQMRLLVEPKRIPMDYISDVLSTKVELPTPPPQPSLPFKKRKPRRNEPLSESLKHAISVFEFVSRYVDLNERGIGICPFHDDHKPSFGVNKERNYWSCFKDCGGGSIIDFWMKWREAHGQSSDFSETVKELRQMLLY